MIDSHVHFWQPARGDYGWLTPATAALYRDFLPPDLFSMAETVGVSGVIAVQAAPTEAETLYLFALARTEPRILGVVGWADLAADDAADRLGALVRDGAGLLKGVRPMVQDLPDPDWVSHPALDRAFDAIVAHDLVFDALVRAEHLPALRGRLERTPGLRVVIDHAAKPDIAHDGYAQWTEALAPLAAMPSVHCKLSGLLTEASPETPIARYVAWLAKAFGHDRLLWGSDWPVLTLAVDYRTWLMQARALVPDEAVFAANARRVYKLMSGDAVLTLSASDNVGVALRNLAVGDPVGGGVRAAGAIAFGFKVALAPIAAGDKVVKYGVPIGSATRAILPGERVHLENMRSDYTATHGRDLKEGRL